jgi:thiosulfate reductase cytochrome b subunit
MNSRSATRSRRQKVVLVRDSKKLTWLESARYEHPYLVRLTHWISAVATTIMILSGIEIFRAFPSFGDKIPERDLVSVPKWMGLGSWLGGALEWHLTFMWPLMMSGAVYLGYQVVSGNYRQVLFTLGDLPGVLPMVRYYFLRGPRPELNESYNPLQKLAYTSAIILGLMVVLTGLVLWKPVKLSSLAWLMGGFGMVRIWHLSTMLGLAGFTVGHLVMVSLHGWNNFTSMLTGWKTGPGIEENANGG